MSLRVEQVDQDIFTVAKLYSARECQELIQRAESIGFAAASVRTRGGPRMMPNLRNNDRVNLDDAGLADQMWTRVQHLLPTLDDFQATGVDHRIRFYRYLPGQQFRRHRDGRVTNDSGQTSRLSYLIYLNDDYEGGATLFREYESEGDERIKTEHLIVPQTGMALLFVHRRWHEGLPIDAGRKYVVRSDVFYDG